MKIMVLISFDIIFYKISSINVTSIRDFCSKYVFVDIIPNLL